MFDRHDPFPLSDIEPSELDPALLVQHLTDTLDQNARLIQENCELRQALAASRALANIHATTVNNAMNLIASTMRRWVDLQKQVWALMSVRETNQNPEQN